MEAMAILRDIAADDRPYDSDDSANGYCSYCGGDASLDVLAAQWEHDPGCVWVRSRRLVEGA